MSTLQEVLPISIPELLSHWGKEGLFLHSDTIPQLSLAEIEARLNQPVSLSVIDFDHSKFPPTDLYYETHWDKASLDRTKVKSLIDEGRSFIMHNCTDINRDIAEFTDSIEKELTHYHADLHIYISPQANAATYAPHRDRPQHKIFIQLMGEVHWKMYAHDPALLPDESVISVTEEFANQNMKVILDKVAGPGDIIYMPAGVFHKVETLSPRVSLSFPLIFRPDLKRKDRTTIPLSQYFQSSSEKLKNHKWDTSKYVKLPGSNPRLVSPDEGSDE